MRVVSYPLGRNTSSETTIVTVAADIRAYLLGVGRAFDDNAAVAVYFAEPDEPSGIAQEVEFARVPIVSDRGTMAQFVDPPVQDSQVESYEFVQSWTVEPQEGMEVIVLLRRVTIGPPPPPNDGGGEPGLPGETVDPNLPPIPTIEDPALPGEGQDPLPLPEEPAPEPVPEPAPVPDPVPEPVPAPVEDPSATP